MLPDLPLHTKTFLFLKKKKCADITTNYDDPAFTTYGEQTEGAYQEFGFAGDENTYGEIEVGEIT